MCRATKRRRAVRRGGRVVVLTARDLDIMTLLGLTGYVGSHQVAREFFQTTDRARERLRQLYDAGYLTVTLQDSTKPNLLSLSRQGLKVLDEERPELTGRVRLAGAIRLSGVAHHLAIVDARLYVAALGSIQGTPLLRWGNAGSDLGRERGLTRFHLEPDGLAELGSDQEVFTIALEVDRGTEPLSVLRRKCERYVGVALEGQVSGLWLIVAASELRAQSLAALLEDCRLGSFARVIPHTALTERPLRVYPWPGAGAGGEGEGHRP